MSEQDYSNLSVRQQTRLTKMQNKLEFNKAQNDLRVKFAPQSIFQQSPFYNSYMQPQPEANPMQVMMEMIQTMMPMIMMMKMMGIEGGDDMLAGMFGDMADKVKDKTKTAKADDKGFVPEEQTEADKTAGITRATNKKDHSTREVKVEGDITTTTITKADGKKEITIEDKANHTETIKQKDVFYTKTNEDKKKDSSTFKNEVSYSYDDTNDVNKIKFNGKEYTRKEGAGNKYKEEYNIFIEGGKEFYLIPNKGLVEVPKKEEDK